MVLGASQQLHIVPLQVRHMGVGNWDKQHPPPVCRLKQSITLNSQFMMKIEIKHKAKGQALNVDFV